MSKLNISQKVIDLFNRPDKRPVVLQRAAELILAGAIIATMAGASKGCQNDNAVEHEPVPTPISQEDIEKKVVVKYKSITSEDGTTKLVVDDFEIHYSLKEETINPEPTKNR